MMDVPKYLQRRADTASDGRHLIKCREKHATYYYLPSQWGGYFAMCLAIFTRRDTQEGWYPMEAPKEPTKPAALPEGSDKGLEAFQRTRMTAYQAELEDYKRDLDQWTYISAARELDGVAAAILLDLRKGYEYEDFDDETLEQPKP